MFNENDKPDGEPSDNAGDTFNAEDDKSTEEIISTSDNEPTDESTTEESKLDDKPADNDTSDKSELIALTKKEKQKRLYITLAAGLVIVGLIVALIVVLVNPGGDDASDFRGNYVSDLPAPNGDDFAEHRDPVCPDEVLAQLRNYDGDDFTSFFTEMMFQYGEDPGMFASPGGYLFMQGVMVEEFYNAAAALEIGEISGLVESVHGIHIIYRIPIDPDAIYPHSQHTLRMVYAIEALHLQIEEWVEDLDYEFSDEYHTLNFLELFGVSQDADADSDSAEAPTDAQNTQSLSDIDFEEILALFEPNTRMITAGDYYITWEELFSIVYMGLASLYEGFGYVPDLAEPLGDDEQPFHEVLLEIPTQEMVSRLALRYNAAMLNISLSDEDYQSFEDFLAEMIEEQGGEDEFAALLWERLGIRDFELYKQIQITHLLPQTIFDELYGENGELFPTDEVLRLAEEGGYIMAKHILIRHDSIAPG